MVSLVLTSKVRTSEDIIFIVFAAQPHKWVLLKHSNYTLFEPFIDFAPKGNRIFADHMVANFWQQVRLERVLLKVCLVEHATQNPHRCQLIFAENALVLFVQQRHFFRRNEPQFRKQVVCRHHSRLRLKHTVSGQDLALISFKIDLDLAGVEVHNFQIRMQHASK